MYFGFSIVKVVQILLTWLQCSCSTSLPVCADVEVQTLETGWSSPAVDYSETQADYSAWKSKWEEYEDSESVVWTHLIFDLKMLLCLLDTSPKSIRFLHYLHLPSWCDSHWNTTKGILILLLSTKPPKNNTKPVCKALKRLLRTNTLNSFSSACNCIDLMI